MFTVGFIKIAQFDHNNQGLEFQMADDGNASPNVGPGGMTPGNIPSYQPSGEPPTGDKKPKKKLNPQEMGQFFMQKGASLGVDNMGRMDQEARGDEGTESLKYDSTTPNATQEEQSDSSKSEKKRMKKYIRAGLK